MMLPTRKNEANLEYMDSSDQVMDTMGKLLFLMRRDHEHDNINCILISMMGIYKCYIV